MKARIVVHGGAGFWRRDIRRGLLGVSSAASHGMDILGRGGSALDAVEAAVGVMEDNPVFNAGKGSSLTLTGEVEMDAAIMDGRDLSAGAVALIHRVKNPIHLARIIMEKTDHVLLAGEKAEQLGMAFMLPQANPVTASRRQMFLRFKKGRRERRSNWFERNTNLLKEHPELLGTDTVGAVAVDDKGNFAAAASTGGPMMKLPGRIGGTPQIGSGLYADNLVGAATATGLGEVAIKLAVAKTVCSHMESGLTAHAAAMRAVEAASRRLRGKAGIIAIDRVGHVAVVHNTPLMPWAFSEAKMTKPRARKSGKIVFPVRTVA
jgi:beta-aspartyl-peptidase (threonine type)